jgi:four helix bundle protein
MKVALKELRESDRWLKLSIRVPLIPAKVSAKPLLQETDELIRIFVASIKTAQRNAAK